MSDITTKIYKRTDGLPWQSIDGQSLILNAEEKMAHELNSVASFIWNQLDGQKKIEDILNNICEEFEVDKSCAQEDMKCFLDELEVQRLIECL